jgi:16S rRNA (guanine(966)-N(2))-methyltransferase RsmD
MRITGGILAGRAVRTPPGVIRPSMDRMRESVFGALGGLSGKSFLDLFSGSGVIALEAASRGASFVEAVESDRGKSKTLLENVAISPVRIECRFMAVELYIKRAKKTFDVIFCDPPFPYQFKSELIDSISRSILAGETKILLHRPKSEKIALSNENPSFSLIETRLYGNSAVDFFQKTSL